MASSEIRIPHVRGFVFAGMLVVGEPKEALLPAKDEGLSASARDEIIIQNLHEVMDTAVFQVSEMKREGLDEILEEIGAQCVISAKTAEYLLRLVLQARIRHCNAIHWTHAKNRASVPSMLDGLNEPDLGLGADIFLSHPATEELRRRSPFSVDMVKKRKAPATTTTATDNDNADDGNDAAGPAFAYKTRRIRRMHAMLKLINSNELNIEASTITHLDFIQQVILNTIREDRLSSTSEGGTKKYDENESPIANANANGNNVAALVAASDAYSVQGILHMIGGVETLVRDSQRRVSKQQPDRTDGHDGQLQNVVRLLGAAGLRLNDIKVRLASAKDVHEKFDKGLTQGVAKKQRIH